MNQCFPQADVYPINPTVYYCFRKEIYSLELNMLNTLIISLSALSLYSSFLIFKDMADISQWFVQSKRKTTINVWYKRKPIALLSFLSLTLAWVSWWGFDSGISLEVITSISIVVSMLFFSGYINPRLMMRERQKNGTFVGIEEAQKYYKPCESVIAFEINGNARGHSDRQMLRPHVAGNDQLDGSNAVMTYCGLTNLGMAIIPELDGKPLALRPMTQLENNLLMVDDNSGEPVQQLWMKKECDIEKNSKNNIQQVATFRVPFKQFCLAYPKGQLFVNDYLEKGIRSSLFSNPIVYIYDRLIEQIFSFAVTSQKSKDELVFPTIKYVDSRLSAKTKIWGFNIGDDYVAYTEEFVKQRAEAINTIVGGRKVVISYDSKYMTLGIFYNHTNENINSVDIHGLTENEKKLERVETVKAGAYWVIWANFFKSTSVNRINEFSQE
jgi:hypothetical protein